MIERRMDRINQIIIARQLQARWSQKAYENIAIQHRDKETSAGTPPDGASVIKHQDQSPTQPPAPDNFPPEPIPEPEPAPEPQIIEPAPETPDQDQNNLNHNHPAVPQPSGHESDTDNEAYASALPGLKSFLSSEHQIPLADQNEKTKPQPPRKRFRPDPLVATVAAVIMASAGAGVWKWQYASTVRPEPTNVSKTSTPEPKHPESDRTKNQPAVALPSLNPTPQNPTQEITEAKPQVDSPAPSPQAVAADIQQEVQNINGMVQNVRVNHKPDGVSEIDMLRAIAVRLSALEKRIDTALPPLPDLPDTPPLQVNSKHLQINTAPPARWHLQRTSGDVRIYTLETHDLLAISSRMARFGGPRPIQIGVGQPFPEGGNVASIDVDRLMIVVRKEETPKKE
jgi:hypothetical protein